MGSNQETFIIDRLSGYDDAGLTNASLESISHGCTSKDASHPWKSNFRKGTGKRAALLSQCASP